MTIIESSVEVRAADGVSVPGILVSPDSPIGSFLLLHGISTDKNEYLGFLRSVAHALFELGFRSLRIDFRGHGDSGVSPLDFTIGSQVMDCLAAIAYLRQTSSDRVNLFGCSFGAPPCLFVNEMVPETIGAISMLAPVLDYRRVFIEPESDWGRDTFNGKAVGDCVSRGLPIKMGDHFAVGPKLLASMYHSDIQAYAARVNKRVSVFHGDNDGIVPLAISQQIAEIGERFDLHIFKNMEHGFTDKGDEDGSHPATKANVAKIIGLLEMGAVRGG